MSSAEALYSMARTASEIISPALAPVREKNRQGREEMTTSGQRRVRTRGSRPVEGSGGEKGDEPMM